MEFLQVKNGKIANSRGEPFLLKGIALGGWLMMEGYMLGGRNIPEHVFKEKIKKELGETALKEFTIKFRGSFFSKNDVINIKKLGANVARLPFNYRLLEKSPYLYDEDGFNLLKKVVGWFKKKNIYVILDLHSAPGSQNPDWHSDFWPEDFKNPKEAKPMLWENKDFQKRTYSLWQKIAQTFKDEPAVAGYDILNEPVTKNWQILNELYSKITEAVRKSDKNHIIFYEGNFYARDFSKFKRPNDENSALSIHFYDPLEFVFGWITSAQYPGTIKGVYWNKEKIEKILKEYYLLGKKLKMPVYLGEFGVASRCPECSAEYRWVKDVLDICRKFNFHWTYWTYKSVSGAFYPDGIYQFHDYEGLFQIYWIPSGVEKFPRLLKENKNKLFKSFKTENFTLNKKLADILKKYF